MRQVRDTGLHRREVIIVETHSRQVAGIGQVVVPKAPHDSLHILDALPNLNGGVEPETATTDNASYSDMVSGPFKTLGHNLGPRFRGPDDQRFWWATTPGAETGPYGAVEDPAPTRVNLNKVITHWPDRPKVAGSLVTDQGRAYELLCMFEHEGRRLRWARRAQRTDRSSRPGTCRPLTVPRPSTGCVYRATPCAATEIRGSWWP